MTDIYVSQEKSRRGCFLLLLLVIAAVALSLFIVRSFLQRKPDDVHETRVDASTAIAAPLATTADPQASSAALQQAQTAFADGRLQDARAILLTALAQNPAAALRAEIEQTLGEVHTKLVFTPAAMTNKIDHLIQRGDTLGVLASRHNTTVELIQRSNNIQSNLIRVGDRIRVLEGRYRVHVDKSDNILEVFLNGQFFKRYRVGTGQYNRTPAGIYKITLRQKHPTWYRNDGKEIPYGDPENLLGTHYLKLDTPGIGIHGTWDDDSIGSQSSAGCVRLKNEEIEELYLLLPIGTPVEIVD